MQLRILVSLSGLLFTMVKSQAQSPTDICPGYVPSIMNITAPPEFPDFQAIFSKSLDYPKYRNMFDNLMMKNTAVDNCKCNKPILLSGLDDLNNNKCSKVLPTDCTVTTTVIPTTTLPETTTALPTTLVDTTPVEGPLSTTQEHRNTTAVTSKPSVPLSPSTSVPPVTDGPITASFTTRSWTISHKEMTEASQASTESPVTTAVLSTPKADATVPEKDTPSVAVIVVICVVCGIVVMGFVAMMFALCRKRCGSAGPRREKALRQMSDCQHLSVEGSDTFISQPPTPQKKHSNDLLDDVNTSDQSSSGSGSADSGLIIFTDNRSAPYSNGTLKTIDHPHALNFGGYGESTTETLPKKKSQKKKQGSSKSKSTPCERRRSASSLTKKFSKTPVEGADSNYNTLTSLPGLPCYGDGTMKVGQAYVNYENEMSNGSVTPATPDTHSLTTLISGGGNDSCGNLDVSTDVNSPDDLVGHSNVHLFAYENPALVRSNSSLDHPNESLHEVPAEADVNLKPQPAMLPPPSNFADSLSDIKAHEDPIGYTTKKTEIPQEQAKESPTDEDIPTGKRHSEASYVAMDFSIVKSKSVKERASIFEGICAENHTNSGPMQRGDRSQSVGANYKKNAQTNGLNNDEEMTAL